MALSEEPFWGLAHVASPARWWVLLVTTLTNMLQNLMWNCFSPISGTVKLAYGWTDSDFAWAVNAANISFMLALLPVNKLYQRYGARYSMLLATAFLAFSGVIRCVPVTHGRSFMVLVQLSMLANGITAAWSNIAGPLISDLWFPAEERTLATAIAIAGGPVGQALGFVVGPSLMSPGAVDRGVQEVQQLMCLEATVSVALFLAATIYFPATPPSPPSESAAAKRQQSGGGYARLLPTSPQACRFWLLNLCLSLPTSSYQSWSTVLNLNMAHATGIQMSSNAVALLGCVMTLSGAAGGIVVGLVTKRLLGALKSFILLLAGVSLFGFLVFATLLTGDGDVGSGFGTFALGAAGVLGGCGLNCMLPLFYELIFETVYGFLRDDVAATTANLTMAVIQMIILAVPLKIGGSSLWMNWLLVTCVFLCFGGVLSFRVRYLRLEADVMDEVANCCDRSGCI